MQSFSDISSENTLALVRQEERSTTSNSSINIQHPTTLKGSLGTTISQDRSIPKKCTGEKRKQLSNVEEQLGNAVDAFKSFVTHKNMVHAEDESLKYLCDSLYGDMKNLNKKDLIISKIKIMQIISR